MGPAFSRDLRGTQLDGKSHLNAAAFPEYGSGLLGNPGL
jgi:hypothetical protein